MAHGALLLIRELQLVGGVEEKENLMNCAGIVPESAGAVPERFGCQQNDMRTARTRTEEGLDNRNAKPYSYALCVTVWLHIRGA